MNISAEIKHDDASVQNVYLTAWGPKGAYYGYLFVIIEKVPTEGNTLYLGLMYMKVERRHQRRGVATALVDYARSLAPSHVVDWFEPTPAGKAFIRSYTKTRKFPWVMTIAGRAIRRSR